MPLAIRPRYKLQYFDRSIIKRNWQRMNETPGKKAGLLVRRIARQSIRRGGKKRKPSLPGRPPHSHKTGATPPFKMIFSLPSGLAQTIVGMVGFGTKGGEPVPGTHEHGLVRQVIIRDPTKRRKANKRQAATARRMFLEGVLKPPERTFQLQPRKYPERPFMVPALQKAAPKLPALWANSLR